MKKVLSLLFFAVIASVVNAQDEPDPVEVDMKVTNLSPSFFDINIPLIGVSVNRPNTAMFAGLGAKFKAGRIYCEGGVNLFYANGLNGAFGGDDTDIATETHSIYDYRSPKQYFINTGFILLQKSEKTNIVFKLRQTGRTVYITKVPTEQSNFIMINLGFKTGFDWVYCKGKDLTFDGVNVPDGFSPPDPENVRTMMDFTTIRIGASYGKMGFWKAKIKKYGTRTNKKFFRYYADLLILVASNIDPIYAEHYLGYSSQSPYEKLYTKYELNNSKRSPVGFVVGVSKHNLDKFGSNLGAEMGIYPGIKGGFLSQLGLTINAAISFGKVFN
jgi:hypothetical protein